jgi:hypothetical protein
MLPPVKLDYEVGSQAGEIDNQMIDRSLPAEMKSFCFQDAKRPPQLSLRVRLIAAEKPRTFDAHAGAPPFRNSIKL